MYGSKDEGAWFDDPDGAMFIGNELRRCNFVGFFLKWDSPVPGGVACMAEAKHVITAWGDDVAAGEGQTITQNPTRVWVTDSDRSTDDPPGTGPAKEDYGYVWDDVNSQWEIDYCPPPPGAPDPYLWNVVTLSQPDTECDGTGRQVVGSYKVQHKDKDDAANDLHYKAGAYDSPRICTYETTLDWTTDDNPQIVKYHTDEGCITPECEYIEVDWDLTGEEVPGNTDVTITTKFLLPNENVISYEDVQFTRDGIPILTTTAASFGWRIDTPTTDVPSGGGFVIGAFKIYDDPLGGPENLIGEYRFQHEYGDDQSPDCHRFRLDSLGDATVYVDDLSFGQSEGLLDTQVLWAFDTWIEQYTAIRSLPAGGLIRVDLEWGVGGCIPTVSAWGLAVLCLTVLSAGTLVLRRRRAVTAR